jgi:hypothetical protein
MFKMKTKFHENNNFQVDHFIPKEVHEKRCLVKYEKNALVY